MKKLIEDFDLKTNKLLRKIVDDAKRVIKEDGKCPPMAFMVSEEKIAAFEMPMEHIPKEACYKIVSKMSDEMNADIIIFCMEAWSADTLTKEEYEAHVKSNKSLSGHPKAKEILSFTVLTPTGSWMGTLEIDSKAKKAEGTPIFIKPDKMGGMVGDYFNRATVH